MGWGGVRPLPGCRGLLRPGWIPGLLTQDSVCLLHRCEDGIPSPHPSHPGLSSPQCRVAVWHPTTSVPEQRGDLVQGSSPSTRSVARTLGAERRPLWAQQVKGLHVLAQSPPPWRPLLLLFLDLRHLLFQPQLRAGMSPSSVCNGKHGLCQRGRQVKRKLKFGAT